MRRMQANLAYLAADAERHHKRPEQLPAGPAIMTAPMQTPEMVELYAKLQAIFPGWKGRAERPSPGPQTANASTNSTPRIS